MDSLEKIEDLRLIGNQPKKSLGQMIYEVLRKSIIRGDIPSGQRLVEEKLAKTTGASRTPVREALRRLEQEKLIARRPSGGHEIRKISRKEIEEIFGIRSILESYAAALAAKRIGAKDIETLEEIISTSASALERGEIEAFIQTNTAFHDCLYQTSQSERLCQMIHNLRDYFYRCRRVILLIQGMPEVSLRDHEEMIRAMRARDDRAVEHLVKAHIQRGMELVLREIDEGRLTV